MMPLNFIHPWASSLSLSTSSFRCTRRNLLFLLSVPLTAKAVQPRALFSMPTRGLKEGEAAEALPDTYPDEFPYVPADFARYDEKPDTYFYSYPRLVSHIDDGCIAALRQYCSREMNVPEMKVLDLAASYVSYHPSTARGFGLGMNSEEMSRNPALTDFRVLDLNTGGGIFPYEDAFFDAAICVVSIDYYTKPVNVLRECGRVLKPGGKVYIAFSDRMFADKAVALWTRSGDADHIYAVGSFVHYSGSFDKPKIHDLSPRGRFKNLLGDPLYVIEATKRTT